MFVYSNLEIHSTEQEQGSFYPNKQPYILTRQERYGQVIDYSKEQNKLCQSSQYRFIIINMRSFVFKYTLLFGLPTIVQLCFFNILKGKCPMELSLPVHNMVCYKTFTLSCHGHVPHFVVSKFLISFFTYCSYFIIFHVTL